MQVYVKASLSADVFVWFRLTQRVGCPAVPPVTGAMLRVRNALGFVLRRRGRTVPYTFNDGYSLTDVLTSMTYPSGRQITYGLDAADRVTSVQNVGTGWNYATLSYKASGAVSSLSTHNGVSQTFSWNEGFSRRV